MELWELFLAFFRIGIFGYGGGPPSILSFGKSTWSIKPSSLPERCVMDCFLLAE